MKKKFNIPKKLAIPPGLWIILLLIGGYILVMRQPYRNLKAFPLQHITVFRIYPGVGKPVESSIEFQASDPIIQDFFNSLEDFRFYLPSHDRSLDGWLLEVAAGGAPIQMKCYIPSHKEDTVIIHFGSFGKWTSSYYAAFQSKLLFQWYQKYSSHWLESPDDQQKKRMKEDSLRQP